MAGYLNKIKELQQSKRSSVVPRGDIDGSGDGSQKPTEYCEISEISEKRSALLLRLRTGHDWLLEQHHLWQSSDPKAADDAAFSKAWAGWWDLDFQLRARYGLAGCIFAPVGKCSQDFGCIGCVDVPTPSVVAQLALT